MNTTKTEQQFKDVMQECHSLFAGKLHDYGASWRMLRPSSLTEGLIQLEQGFADHTDMSPEEALALYERHAGESLKLMLKKNHDYDEAWRSMRVSSYTDFILTKIQRVKEIEDLNGQTLVSEGIASNYMDIINYAVFGAIKLAEEKE